MNPSRTKTTEYRPARVTVAILAHVPYLAGYYQHRLSVLKASLWSLQANTQVPYDLMVFDNGSGPEASAYLRTLSDDGEITFLMRSDHNLGKLGALRILFAAAPGELIAYADDDFYYHPGWLEEHLRIVDTYPNVGMVGGYAIPSFFTGDRTSANQRAIQAHPEMTAEPFRPFPESWIREWAESTGRDPEAALAEEARFTPMRYTYLGVQSLGAANHDQFLCPKAVILNCLPRQWSGELMGQMIELDRAVDQAGYLRLSTAERTTQHIGNLLSPELTAKLPAEFGPTGRLDGGDQHRPVRRPWGVRLLLWPPIRWFLLGVYSRLFRWINPE